VDGLLTVTEGSKEAGQPMLGKAERLLAQAHLGESDGALEERARLGEPLLCKTKLSKIIECFRDVRVVQAKSRLLNRKRALVQRFSPRVVPLGLIEDGKVDE